MSKLRPEDGGCWFCFEDETKEGLICSWEFDTNLHYSCLIKSVQTQPLDPITEIMGKELLQEDYDEIKSRVRN